MLSQERLKELLHYDPETGVFTKLVSRTGRWPAGEVSGTTGPGRRQIQLDGKIYRSHRLAFLYMTGRWPEHGVDHIDGNNSNNSWENLREATQSINGKNCKRPYHSPLGVCGVRFYRGYYCARIKVEQVEIGLGRFNSLFDAIAARKSAELKYNFHPNHGRK